ncbi:MAG: metal-dependent transcriptional regulator [Anaerolineae bacterium]|nr:metal-dependent transcriptional regulator [Anaerolineae bacterium]
MPQIRSLPDGSSPQRHGLNHQAVEDYLKTIYKLARTESPVSTSRLAEARDVKPASATGMIKRLSNLGLADYEKHRGVTLTPEGEQIALEVIRHHRLIELYLIEALGFTWDEVHDEADLLEHVISEKLEERIAAVLGNPQFDPHGDPIPSKEGTIEIIAARSLTLVEAGQTVRVIRVRDDHKGDLLRYLAQRGLQPGVEVMVTSVEPFDGPLTIMVAGNEHIIGRKAAGAVLVDTG